MVEAVQVLDQKVGTMNYRCFHRCVDRLQHGDSGYDQATNDANIEHAERALQQAAQQYAHVTTMVHKCTASVGDQIYYSKWVGSAMLSEVHRACRPVLYGALTRLPRQVPELFDMKLIAAREAIDIAQAWEPFGSYDDAVASSDGGFEAVFGVRSTESQPQQIQPEPQPPKPQPAEPQPELQVPAQLPPSVQPEMTELKDAELISRLSRLRAVNTFAR